MKKNEINNLVLWIIILVVLTPLSFIGGMIFCDSLQKEFTLIADSASSWVSAIATVSISILTFILAKETWYLRIAQNEQLEQLRLDAIRPSVDFAFKISDVHVQLLDLEIKNTGKGIAKNVTFEFLNIDGKSELEKNPIIDKLEELGAIKNGIASLGIGQSYKTFIFSFIDIMGEMGEDETFSARFLVRILFVDANGHEYKNEVSIDFSQYIGVVNAGGGSPGYNISKNIERIANWAESLTSSQSNRLTVNTFNSEERKQEYENLERMRKELMEKTGQ